MIVTKSSVLTNSYITEQSSTCWIIFCTKQVMSKIKSLCLKQPYVLVWVHLNHAFDCTALSRYVECPCGVFGLFSLYRLRICIRLRVRACSTRGRCGCPRPRMLLQPGRRVPCGVWDRCGPVGIGISCWRSLRRSAHVAVEHWTACKALYASIVASVK